MLQLLAPLCLSRCPPAILASLALQSCLRGCLQSGFLKEGTVFFYPLKPSGCSTFPASDVGAQQPTVCLHRCQTTVLPARFWAESAARGQISARGLGTGRVLSAPGGSLLSCKCPNSPFGVPAIIFQRISWINPLRFTREIMTGRNKLWYFMTNYFA